MLNAKATMTRRGTWNGKKLLIVNTMGLFSGDGTGCTARLLKKYGASILGGMQIKMPDSVCDSKLLKKDVEENRQIVRSADNRIEQAAEQMRQGNYPQEGLSVIDPKKHLTLRGKCCKLRNINTTYRHMEKGGYMERIQFYPPEQLKELLYADASSKGISVSALVIQILQEHYNATPQPEMTLAEAIPQVLDEVKAYIKTKAQGEKFDLLTASQTFRKINMIVEGRPSANRATIGKVFGGKLGSEPFENIEVSYIEKGKRELSSNRATMYIIKKESMV